MLKMNKKLLKTVIFIAVLLIPVIYSFFYLKSYWDPYGNLEDLQVAIVNKDLGEDDKNQGKELIKSLQDSKSIKICDVDEKEAEDGLVNGKYYAKITIPEDFTKSLNNAQNADREKTIITFSPNKKTNYLAYQIINNVVTKTELSMQAKISKEVVASLKEKLQEVPEKMEDINDGVSKIQDGANTLNNGLKELNDGTTKLDENYTEFDKGVESCYEGSKSLQDGINSVKNGTESLENGSKEVANAVSQIQSGTEELASKTASGITSLANGAESLASGSKELNSGIEQYVSGVDELNKNTENIINGVLAMGMQNPALLQDENFKMLYGGAMQIKQSEGFSTIKTSGDTIKQASSKLQEGASTLNAGMSGINQISGGMNALISGVSKLNNGVQSLEAGSKALNNGTTEVSEGSKKLTEGLNTLDSSSKQVKEGIAALSKGSLEAYNGGITLENGVNTLKSEISNGIENTKQELTKLDGLDTYTEDPIEIKEESYGEVKEYGVSFTPLFLSIGLWVGALMCYVVLYYDQENRFKLLGKYAENKFVQIGLYFGIAILQGILTGILLKLGLGFNVQNVFLYYSSCTLIAIAFMSVIQFLIVNFGDIGKFIALIILVLQLAASGGTFPVETIDKGFRVLTNFLPMTYAIRLLKESLVLIDNGFAGKNILMLLAFTVVPLVITLITRFIKQQNQKNENTKVESK